MPQTGNSVNLVTYAHFYTRLHMDFNAWRRRRISEPAYRWARKAMPGLSDTEREAIEAGDVWWDADLFTGDPDWNKLLAVPQATLTAAEQQFLDGPVAQLCAMLDEWDITWHQGGSA